MSQGCGQPSAARVVEGFWLDVCPQRSAVGQKRSNVPHASTTDPDAHLSKENYGGEARLSYMGHVLTENRNGLVVDSRLSISSGTAEIEAAVEMVGELPGN